MSNFKCPHCGMINIDCGRGKFKTPGEIELEKQLKEQSEKIKSELEEIRQKLKMEKYSNYSLKEQLKEQDAKIHQLEFELEFKERALKSARKQNGTYWHILFKDIVIKALQKMKKVKNTCK